MPPAFHQPPPAQQPRVYTIPVQQPRVKIKRTTQNQPRPNTGSNPPNPTHTYNLRPRPCRISLTTSQQERCNAIYDESTGKKMSYRQLKQQNLEVWNPIMANKIGCLAQGYKKIKGTNTITFIAKQDIPDVAKVTYARIIPDYRPLKDEPYRTRLTVSRDRLPYYDETKTDTASLPIIKTHLNSTISTPDAKYATADIKNFYPANNKLKYPEFMRIHLTDLPDKSYSNATYYN